MPPWAPARLRFQGHGVICVIVFWANLLIITAPSEQIQSTEVKNGYERSIEPPQKSRYLANGKKRSRGFARGFDVGIEFVFREHPEGWTEPLTSI